jgi:type IV pilus assembly protein PilZ
MSEHDSYVPTASRRSEERHEVRWAVDCASGDTFLYAYITNVSSLGLFVYTEHPLPVGTRVQLVFAPAEVRTSPASSSAPFELLGEVAWINPRRPGHDNPNPGMGVRFVELVGDDRERLVVAIHTIAYVREARGADAADDGRVRTARSTS